MFSIRGFERVELNDGILFKDVFVEPSDRIAERSGVVAGKSDDEIFVSDGVMRNGQLGKEAWHLPWSQVEGGIVDVYVSFVGIPKEDADEVSCEIVGREVEFDVHWEPCCGVVGKGGDQIVLPKAVFFFMFDGEYDFP